MFLCRSRFVVASLFSYNKFAGSVQVATYMTQDAIRALHKSRMISCSKVPARGTNSVRVLHLISGPRQSPISNTCEYVSHAFPACNSLSRLSSPKSPFCIGTETCILQSSTIKLLSALFSAKELEQADGTKRDRATDDQKVMLSNRPQGGCEKPEPEKNQNKTDKLKKVFKEYGAVGVLFHIGISLISLGIFYIVVSSGINMTDVLCKLGFSESFVQSKMAAGTSTFVLAYAIHKLFAPFRISITLVSVPLIVRYLRKTGLFKSSPPRM
ncbi:protein FAM210B, mitochondrial [Silurus meridionalis]|uniref:DUF1279 domain-containing protein n=1 Tax=Silurus meridionalis TaxID=175797 RepID=A0A8T0BVJ6_SILME|nr:protein FAM210B, mitochondrial [Silurus meridionalis]KAF7711312.1 hypothetical protein HF521_000323 [Silurus meridionalis]KAI5108941.1 protein FAM210B [Silurus meridionalis]